MSVEVLQHFAGRFDGLTLSVVGSVELRALHIRNGRLVVHVRKNRGIDLLHGGHNPHRDRKPAGLAVQGNRPAGSRRLRRSAISTIAG
jgi:hypothetical protein